MWSGILFVDVCDFELVFCVGEIVEIVGVLGLGKMEFVIEIVVYVVLL